MTVECPICYEELDQPNKAYFKGSCNHAFHVSCLNASVRAGNKSSCPYCRCDWKVDCVVVRPIAEQLDNSESPRIDEAAQTLFFQSIQILSYPMVFVNAAYLLMFLYFTSAKPYKKVLFVILSSIVFLKSAVSQIIRNVKGSEWAKINTLIKRNSQYELSFYSIVIVQIFLTIMFIIEHDVFIRVLWFILFRNIAAFCFYYWMQDTQPEVNYNYVVASFCIFSFPPFLRALQLSSPLYFFASLLLATIPRVERCITNVEFFKYHHRIRFRYIGFIIIEIYLIVLNGLFLFRDVRIL